ncbi:hypothetical protein [Paraburkholderia sp. CI3]|uniref:hypothetical protein n=1 Tax=Paraburkholderia sp. CI3 TaxID=2991060 RepID=UPI003D2159DD
MTDFQRCWNDARQRNSLGGHLPCALDELLSGDFASHELIEEPSQIAEHFFSLRLSA